MAAIPVSFTGVMWYPDLSVGGGPMPGGPPLGIWGGGNVPVPTPPIYYPSPPVDPGYGVPVRPPGVPTHPIYYPPQIWGPTDPRPSHPIAPGGQPPGIWGGGGVPMPTPPIYLPPDTIPGLKPEHPIYIPPSIWGPTDPRPTHPIVLPPPGSPDKPEVLENWDVKTYWSPVTGWGVAIVPSASHPGVPTPSKPKT